MNKLFAAVLVLLTSSPSFGADWYGCRVAYRPPTADWWVGYVLWGCRDTSQIPETWVLELNGRYLRDLFPLMSAIQENSIGGPITFPIRMSPPTQCDRFVLWAEDEGEIAPEMTRERKIEQVCP